jgi:hypothetical protein
MGWTQVRSATLLKHRLPKSGCLGMDSLNMLQGQVFPFTFQGEKQ